MTVATYRLAGLALGVVDLAAGRTPPRDGLIPGKPFRCFPIGRVKTIDGRRIRAERPDLLAVAAEQSGRLDPLALTCEHGDDPQWGGRLAGEARSLELRPDGLWVTDPAWTAEAVREIRSGARRSVSPTFYGTKDDEGYIRPKSLRDVSLVGVAAIDGLAVVEAGAESPVPPTQDQEALEQLNWRLANSHTLEEVQRAHRTYDELMAHIDMDKRAKALSKEERISYSEAVSIVAAGGPW